MSIDTCKSDVLNVSCGVPQGSIVGPKLFIMHVNYMCNISKLVKYILFADDTSGDIDIRKLSGNMCNVLVKMSTWFAVNRLTLNISKTNYILLGKRMLSRDVVIHIRNVNIERVRVVNFWWVYVNDLLNWNYHIILCKRIYIKESIQAYEIKLEKEAECEEAVWCNIVTGNSTLTVG